MRIGIYASVIASERGHERNTSGHVQVPVHSLAVLRNTGHDVHLVTNQPGADKTMPACLPDGVPIHFVLDGRRRPQQLRGGRVTRGMNPFRVVAQARAMRRVVEEQGLDLLHVFGFVRSACLAGLVRVVGLRRPIVVTLVGATMPARLGRVQRFLLDRVDRFIASTEHTAEALRRHGYSVEVCRHGIVRDLLTEAKEEGSRLGARRRVLFWRDPTPNNGCDTALEAFRVLAPEFPDLSFDFAIRPAWNAIDGIDEVAAAIANVNVHRFPYEDGITIAKLVAESLLVVLPFRDLSVDPQFAIAESLAAGCAMITTDIRSNPELLRDGHGGRLVAPGDADALVAAMRELLVDRDRLEAMGRAAAADFDARWNWDDYGRRVEAVYATLTVCATSECGGPQGYTRSPSDPAPPRHANP